MTQRPSVINITSVTHADSPLLIISAASCALQHKHTQCTQHILRPTDGYSTYQSERANMALINSTLLLRVYFLYQDVMTNRSRRIIGLSDY